MNEVTPELIQEFKDSLHISHGSEDSNLKRMLSSSVSYVERVCGPFDILTHAEAKELVIERSRYAYNDSLEFFEENFLSMIQGLSLSLLPDVAEEDVIV
ncbi:phage gp6-like head-tail connector protein [Planococcus sp. SE5232]|uniref:phage gp6-like head-tail connector protein n=1 Tax=unclassified Planococcus (in: firmicutes) TaxID=2662419 RepID=UPI003D6A5070